ncbi:MAG: hypothetical protein JNK82_31385 [Myxococcaceae bacterium]|nr:hypothetical protein [Myxococcaceae bacterium]
MPLAPPTPDEATLSFMEKEVKTSGRLDGITVYAWLMRLTARGVTPEQKAALRLGLAMYGARVDPAATDLIRGTLAKAS